MGRQVHFHYIIYKRIFWARSRKKCRNMIGWATYDVPVNQLLLIQKGGGWGDIGRGERGGGWWWNIMGYYVQDVYVMPLIAQST